MRRFKLILKGVLLYTTLLLTLLFIIGIDSFHLYYIGASLVVLPLLYYICYKTITEDELEVLSFCKYFNISIKEE